MIVPCLCKMKYKSLQLRQLLFLSIGAVLVLVGCESSYQAKHVQKSGFLDYSLLRKGGEGEALYVYRNPQANWSAYDKVLFDNIMVWRGKGQSCIMFRKKTSNI